MHTRENRSESENGDGSSDLDQYLMEYPRAGTNRRNFTKSEDEQLTGLVSRFGENSWKDIARLMPNRNTRQCKERWNSYLSPRINHEAWSEEEDYLLIQKYKEIGPKWVELSKYFKGRSDNNVKNRWYTHLRKRPDQSKSQRCHIKVPKPKDRKSVV